MELQKGFSYFTKNTDIAKVTHVYECGLLPVHGVVEVGDEKIKVRWSKDGTKCSISEHAIDPSCISESNSSITLDEIFSHTIGGYFSNHYRISTDFVSIGSSVDDLVIVTDSGSIVSTLDLGTNRSNTPPQDRLVARVTGNVDGREINYDSENQE